MNTGFHKAASSRYFGSRKIGRACVYIIHIWRCKLAAGRIEHDNFNKRCKSSLPFLILIINSTDRAPFFMLFIHSKLNLHAVLSVSAACMNCYELGGPITLYTILNNFWHHQSLVLNLSSPLALLVELFSHIVLCSGSFSATKWQKCDHSAFNRSFSLNVKEHCVILSCYLGQHTISQQSTQQFTLFDVYEHNRQHD